MSSKNPYGSATDAYGKTAASTDPRAMEGKILLKAALKLEQLALRLKNQENPSLEDISDAVDYNRKLWTVFLSDTMNPDHPLPQDIKNNIASLGMFVFKRSIEILTQTTPEKIKPLVDINRNIAAGLMKQPKQEPSVPTADAATKQRADSLL